MLECWNAGIVLLNSVGIGRLLMSVVPFQHSGIPHSKIHRPGGLLGWRGREPGLRDGLGEHSGGRRRQRPRIQFPMQGAHVLQGQQSTMDDDPPNQAVEMPEAARIDEGEDVVS
jgi:hypothetical protein